MVSFRPALHSDSELILQYIRDLAVAEKFPFQVSVTLLDIENNLFGENSPARAVIFSKGEKPCGFAVYYSTFSTTTGRQGLHLDDLYIEPELQGKGIGKRALMYLAQIAKEKGCSRFEWWALKTNDPAIKFYLGIGAKQLDEISVFRLDQHQIASLAKDNTLNHT